VEEKRYKDAFPVTLEQIAAIRASAPKPRGEAVVSGGEVDEVRLSAVVFENPTARKSLTIHHLQRRLAELGYDLAYRDKDGWFSHATREAVRQFQKQREIAGDGEVNAETFLAIFDGDVNVNPIID
jgi:peptidoglycan hydrolase-like protein with peptidoglycan-binding domain